MALSEGEQYVGPADKTLAILSHILGLFTGFIGPLVIYLVAKDEPTKAHARTALNWQISFLIYFIAAFVLVFVFIGFLLIPVLIVLDIVFCILAAVKASSGILWKYPLSIPLIR